MNRSKPKSPAFLIGCLLLLSLFVANIYRSCKPVWQFDSLEENASEVITGSELQAWAINVLALYPTNESLKVSELGTNFPKQLLKLAPKLGPRIWIYEGYDTNAPRWLRLDWGSGFLGGHGFEIGPTNFVSLREGHVWQPGVYFYSR